MIDVCPDLKILSKVYIGSSNIYKVRDHITSHTHVFLVVVDVDWRRKSWLLCVQDLLRQFETRREPTEDGNINILSLSCLND